MLKRTEYTGAVARGSTPDAEGGPAVSVVIVSWNTRDRLRDCLHALRRAAGRLDQPVEIFVVDNASRDGSAGMVRAEFGSVAVIDNAANLGFAAAVNQGVRASRGRRVLLLNPDTQGSETFLAEMMAFLDAHPSAGAVGPRLVDARGEAQVSCFPLPTLAREMWRLFHLDRVHAYAAYPKRLWEGDGPQRVDTVQGACILIRREALEETGLLDERFFIYTEEVDLCRRLIGKGWEIFWTPAAVVTHYGGESTRQDSARMFLELYRSKIQYFRKHGGARGAFAYKAVLLSAILPRLLAPSLLMALSPSRRADLAAVVGNYFALLRRLPAL